MINNRQQNGRRRGRGGQRPQGGNPGRMETGNRIDNRARGNASQLHEKYKTLARDAQMQGDRVNTEYYLQFADHYFRVLNESRSRFEEQNRQRQQNDQFDDDGEDYGDEGEPVRADQHQYQPRPEGDRRAPRMRGSEDHDAGQPQPQPAKAGRPDGEQGDEAPRDAAPRRRGRPPRDRVEEPAQPLDADRLPPSLGLSATPANDGDGDEAPKPRRRRTRTAAAEAPQAG